ncbi:MAG: ABC transporter substrate-binding protein [Streptosporangiales bacterium]
MRRLFAVLAAAVLALTLAGCGGGGNPLSGGGGNGGGSSKKMIVGSANFPEDALIAEIYAQALEGKGLQVKRKFNIGAREAYAHAMQDGSINLIPEYTGNLWLYLSKSKSGRSLSPEQVYAKLKKSMPKGQTVLKMSSAEDKDAIAVTQETANKYNLKAIGDLKPYAPKMVLGGPPEWPKRPDGPKGQKRVYGLDWKQFKALDTAGPITVKSLKDGSVDAADLFTTQSAIAQNNFVALQDPKHLFLAQNVVPWISKKVTTPKVRSTLNAISAKLTTGKLKKMNKQITVDKTAPAVVAKQFLDQNGLAS